MSDFVARIRQQMAMGPIENDTPHEPNEPVYGAYILACDVEGHLPKPRDAAHRARLLQEVAGRTSLHAR